ncbi:MAG: PIN domain-containing protein [Pleurocapsa sp.]
MKYLLDTTTVSDYLKKNKMVVEKLHHTSPIELAICAITKFEIAYGLANKPSLKDKYKQQLDELYCKTNDLVIDSKIAELAGEIRSELKNAGTPIGVPDILIAATACHYNLIVVTSNLKDFQRVKKKELKLEDWKNS